MELQNNKLYVPVGEYFTYEGRTYITKEVKTITCNGCALLNRPLCHQLQCVPSERLDKKWTMFKEVNKEIHL